jgi:prolyl-tRNA synthetase
VAARAAADLQAGQAALLAEATERRDSRTVDVKTIEEAGEAAADGFVRIPWSVLGPGGEARLAEKAVTVRCLVRSDGGVPLAEDEPDLIAVCGRSY